MSTARRTAEPFLNEALLAGFRHGTTAALDVLRRGMRGLPQHERSDYWVSLGLGAVHAADRTAAGLRADLPGFDVDEWLTDFALKLIDRREAQFAVAAVRAAVKHGPATGERTLIDGLKGHPGDGVSIVAMTVTTVFKLAVEWAVRSMDADVATVLTGQDL